MEQEQFILHSNEVPLANLVFQYEGDAQRAAEQFARHNRGVKIFIAKIVACVSEPLPALQWSDGRIAGNGDSGGGKGLVGYGAQDACQTASPNEKAYRSLR